MSINRPKDILCKYSRYIRQCINNVYRDFMNGNNEILTWDGYENITEALGIYESDMDKLISFWKKLRDNQENYNKTKISR